MASSSFIKKLLTDWGVNLEYIKHFEDQEITEEGLLLLKKKDICDLIPKIGPRNAFIERLKIFVKQKRQEKSCNEKNIKVATSSLAYDITACKTSSENVKEPCQRAMVNPISKSPKKSKAKRTMVNIGSVPKTIISLLGETDHDLPSTSMGHPPPGKRKSDGDHLNKQTKRQKRKAASSTTEIFGQFTLSDGQKKREVKKIMENLKSKMENKRSTKLTDFLREKIKMLEEEKEKIVGVFGKSGAGKSSLINTILETNLLPSGNQGSCTSVMIQVKANMKNDQYIAEIDFITVKEWKDELSSALMCKSCPVEDEDMDQSNDDDDDEIITAFYGKDGNGKSLEELMDKKHFNKIKEFHSDAKKIINCDTAEELSEKIKCFTRSDTQDETFEKLYWPLVKCITVKVPKCKDLLEHVVLVDLPGNGDCNKSRDEMWKQFVGNCSAVWIVSDILRATTEKECWEIFDSTVGLFGHGGECESISFICTKTDIFEVNPKEDARIKILDRNTKLKKQVRDKFQKHKEIKKHFSETKDFFKVLTVSSKEYKNRMHLEKEETEIPHLQEFLRNLNDHHTRTQDYISGAYGILSLIQGAKNRNMTDSKEEVCQFLEGRMKNNRESFGECMKEPYKAFNKSLTKGVQQSQDSFEKLMNKVIAPRGKHHSGYHKIVKSLCENDGVYKPKQKKNRGKEINLNESLASCMRSCIDEEFKSFFPNDKHGPIREEIEKCTLDATSLIEKYPSMSLYLRFLESEERELKVILICELREKKKKLYFTLTDSIEESMNPCYRRASEHKGKDSLKRMKDELHQHVKNANIFQKAKDDMLDRLTKLKENIMMLLTFNQEQSIKISFKTPDILSLTDDITEDYNKIKEFMDCSSTAPFTSTAMAACLFKSVKKSGKKQTMKTTSSIDLDPPNMQHQPMLLDSESNDLRVSKKRVPGDAVPEWNQLAVAFVKKNRNALIQRVKMVDSIADELLLLKMIQDEMYAKILKGLTTPKKMRNLLGAVQAAGKKVISTFYEALRKYEGPLLEDLESASPLSK